MLLCHDDELEGRRIAFIFYLVPEWTKEDGGECLRERELFYRTPLCMLMNCVWVNFTMIGEILSAKILMYMV